MSTTFSGVFREAMRSENDWLKPARFVKFAKLAWQVRRERDQLAGLSSRQLADIGIHPRAAEREAQRDIFDLPKSRMK